jgi:ABC-2 type transport system permease protein
MLRTLLQQGRRALVIAWKDIRVYYSKGPVVIYGILFPVFLFLAFMVGRNLSMDFLMPGLLGIILFFTATAISPAVAPWETQARTLERLMSCPVTIPTILLGDILASFAFGLAISLVPIMVGLAIGVPLQNPGVLALALALAALCLSSLGLLLSAAPTSMPSTIMMLSALVKFPIVFISGIFIPLSQLPTWGRGVSYISPLTYFTDIARRCIQGQSFLPLGIDFAALAGFTALFLVLVMRLHEQTMPKRV